MAYGKLSLATAALVSLLARTSFAEVNATENATSLTIQNGRLFASVGKAKGAVNALTLDGQNLLGVPSGSTGILYLDCYCTPQGFWTPGSSKPSYELFSGVDSTGTSYGGIKMSDTYIPTGQVLEQYWFLRDGETGLHSFSRIAYHNESAPFLRNLQEFRTLFRPNSDMWTHLLANEHTYGPLPGTAAKASQVVVQDATWYLGNTPGDAYVQQVADYFTKYTFQDTWRDHPVHGMYADGSKTADGSTFGSWLVMNTLETYYGGPLHSDLVVDGIVYDYMVSNHHGDQTPNITHGFDRTFGPQYYHFNRAPAGTDILTLRADAAQYADPTWNADFYDSIAKHVPNLVTSQQRGEFKTKIDLPKNAKNAIVVLSENGVDFQDNVYDSKVYQYWAEVDKAGRATIPRVKAGTYRVTVYADSVFGQFVQDNVVVTASKTKDFSVKWREESAGRELFRIGTPDKSSGEYRHGYERDQSRSAHLEQYRIYWAVSDFVKDFPNGITYKVGKSDPAKDLNYVHWSVFGGYANSLRTEPYVGNGNVNNWTIQFDVDKHALGPPGPPGPPHGPAAIAPAAPGPGPAGPGQHPRKATFTVQLAGAKTAAGNTDVYNASEPHANLRYTVSVNGRDLEPWVIPYYQSSSCAVRSAVICYNLAHKFSFDAGLLRAGAQNEIVLSLPYNATNYESAVLPRSVYVQYDALRLEVE
ncbi:rhamnogalacturonate lyase [Microdochium bolleyi]|uniref:rhamnogalacturonan endolyase n=1 Tax=Microdochium bolleyi TaxID=196109 RepID=A0A136IKQ8_9PEZI|nr:rhamnogalacturonate lyase [Microdochium bolleyi]